MARGGVLLGSRPKVGTTFKQEGQRRHARLALVAAHPTKVKVGGVLYDGGDLYDVVDEQDRVGGKWFKLRNRFLATQGQDVSEWFALADMGELAVVLDIKAVEE